MGGMDAIGWFNALDHLESAGNKTIKIKRTVGLYASHIRKDGQILDDKNKKMFIKNKQYIRLTRKKRMDARLNLLIPNC